MSNRAARRAAILTGIVLALVTGLAACTTKTTVASWAVPDSYTPLVGGQVLMLNVYGGDCDEPLSAEVLTQDDQAVTVGVLRRVPPGPCNAMAVMHHTTVTLDAPIAAREVRDRSGAVIPLNPSDRATATPSP